MTIAPVTCTIRVNLEPARAFDLFTQRMSAWWPKGKTVGKSPHEAIVLEPREGGRWFERDAEGNETQWGAVLAWNPPSRLLLAWQLNCNFGFNPNLVTEVELTFTPAEGGGTAVRLEHRNLERFGADAADVADRLRGGWPTRLGDFARFAEPTEEFVIHSVPGSPFGRAVMATLEEKGAAYRLAPVMPGQIRSEPHIGRHPFGRVPVLEHGAFSLYETQAILRYVDRVLPLPALTPTDPQRAARMDQVMNILDWYLFNGVCSVIVFQRVVGPKLMGLTPDEAMIETAMPKGHRAFAELTRLLGEQDYFAGNDVSLADILVAAHLDLLALTPEWLAFSEPNPTLARWLDRMLARPSFQATTWERVAEIAKAA